MELKWRRRRTRRPPRVVLIAPLWNWNGGIRHRGRNLDGVLIAPLWNWNLDRFNGGLPRARSNRTFMELKSTQNGGDEVPTACSNRTFMELKCSWTEASILRTWCSNRTFMELKSAWNSSPTTPEPVLIAPLWNWNNGQGVGWKDGQLF